MPPGLSSVVLTFGTSVGIVTGFTLCEANPSYTSIVNDLGPFLEQEQYLR